MATVHTELVQHIIDLEAIRAFIHPIIPTIWRSPDDVAEADAIHQQHREA